VLHTFVYFLWIADVDFTGRMGMNNLDSILMALLIAITVYPIAKACSAIVDIRDMLAKMLATEEDEND